MSRSRKGGRHWFAPTSAEMVRRRKYDDSRERSRLQRDSAQDPVCFCSFITGMEICPNCGGRNCAVDSE